MKSINNLFPYMGTGLEDVLGYIIKYGDPICLYTYETCNACYSPNASLYIRDDEDSQQNYSLIKSIVTPTYGSHRMDNKITLKYSVKDAFVYITHWDGRISISTDVYFFSSVEGANSYRVVAPYRNEFEWYVDHAGNKYEDFEQSIGE